MHAWEEWGEACVERFRGMFAFALWDRSQQTLFLARDRLGVKPLYYAAAAATACSLFGSELKSLLVHPGCAREHRSRAVEDYFALGYVPEPRTIFTRGAQAAAGPHADAAARRSRSPAPRRYWDVRFTRAAASRAERRAGRS